ncbi:unnamed protein product [Effrenium voratum]|uniref:Uncharacterized protein n=1 Tax=Effrenium voratum TaxID=2562239 RepID=A0AA36MIP3_9DINO|nr:unnamed protein product [Effrenium voratum]
MSIIVIVLMALAQGDEILSALDTDDCADCAFSALQVRAVADQEAQGYCQGQDTFCVQTSESTCRFWKEKGCWWESGVSSELGKMGHCSGSDMFCRTESRSSCTFWRDKGCRWVIGGAREHHASCHGSSMFCSTTSKSTCDFWENQGCTWQ